MNWAHFLTVMALALMVCGPILGPQIVRWWHGRDPFRSLPDDWSPKIEKRRRS